MTREDWLKECKNTLAGAGSPLATYHRYGRAQYIPSFPARARRTVSVGSLVTDSAHGTLGLVSPLISDSTEVALVVHWLGVRAYHGMYDDATLRRAGYQQSMAYAGFVAPFTACVPNDALLERITRLAQEMDDTFGPYPSAYVEVAPVRTQSTRLLKVACASGHREYILRMSATQFDRGAPLCGVCNRYMVIAS